MRAMSCKQCNEIRAQLVAAEARVAKLEALLKTAVAADDGNGSPWWGRWYDKARAVLEETKP